MGIILRQSFINTLYSYAGAVIGFVNVIWLFPYILETDQFGLTRVMISIAIIGAQVSSLGMGNVTLRFFPQFRDAGKAHFGFLFLAVVIPLIGFLLLSLAGYLFQAPIIRFYSDESALFGEYFPLLFPLLLFMVYFHILESYIRSLFDTIMATFFQHVLLRLFQTAAVLVYFAGWVSFGAFMWLFVLTYGLQTLFLLLYVGYRRQLYLMPDFSILTRERVRSMADYAMFAVLGSVTTIALGNIDMLMVGGLTSLSETAIYSVSYYLASMIKIPSKSLVKIAQPMLAESLHKNDSARIYEIYSKSSINQLLVGGLLFLLIWINVDHMYRFLASEYHAGIYVLLFIGFSKLIDMTFGFNATLIRTSSWYRFDLYASILLVVLTIVSNLIFIPMYGITGAAVATFMSILIHNIIYFFYVRHRFGFQPFTMKTFAGILLLLAALGITSLIPVLPFWLLDLAVRSAVALALVITGIVIFHLSPDLESIIHNVYSKLTGSKK